MIFLFKYTQTDNCTYWCDQDIYVSEESLDILLSKLEKIILKNLSELIEKGLTETEIENTEIHIFNEYIPLKCFYCIESMAINKNIFIDITDFDYYVFETVFTDNYTYSINTTVDFNSDLNTINQHIKNAVSEKIEPLFKKYQSLNLKKGKILNLVKENLKNDSINIFGEHFLFSEFVNIDTLELNYKHKLFHIQDYSSKHCCYI